MTNATFVRVTWYASLVSCGVLTGVASTVLVLELALRRLDGPEYVRVRQAEFSYFTSFIGAVTVLTLIAVAMLVIQARRAHSRMLRPAAFALVLLLLALAISLVVNAPINVAQQNWSVQTPPADWASVRDRWQIAHAVRTVAIVLALGCLSAVAFGRSTSDG
jgi:uncharacterized membrane protein